MKLTTDQTKVKTQLMAEIDTVIRDMVKSEDVKITYYARLYMDSKEEGDELGCDKAKARHDALETILRRVSDLACRFELKDEDK